jgi:hypothetical protein
MVKFGATNTGTATLNVNSLGAKNVKVIDGAGASADPTVGALYTGAYGMFRYDGTNMVLLNPSRAKAADIASATTTVLDPANGSPVEITGTTTITAVTLREGGIVFARAAGAFLLTAGASLFVNGTTSLNYTTFAGDLLLFEGYASGVVRVWVIGRTPSSGIAGTQTNDSASSGFIGEQIFSALATGSATSLVNNTAKTVTSITLTPGDWDVSAIGYFNTAATTTLTNIITSISLTNNTLDTSAGQFGDLNFNAVVFNVATTSLNAGTITRISVAVNTIVYLVAQATFGTSTLTAFGVIRARRLR